MDSETKQELQTIALPMKMGRELKEAKVVAESEDMECRQGKEPNTEHIRPRQELLPLEQTVKHQPPPKNANEGIVTGIENYLASAEEFGQAEELLLSVWLLSRKEQNFNIRYNHCQTRRAIRFTFDFERYFINGIQWDYDVDNDYLGEVLVNILGRDFMHQAVWEKYSDSWFDNHWISLESHDEVCKELDDALNSRVHCGGCDELVFDEEPFVNDFIIASALANTRRHNHCSYFLADRENHVYMVYDKKRDEEGGEYWQLINGWSETVALLPLGRLRLISEEECARLLLQQELIISDGFGEGEDEIWSPSEKKLLPIAAKGS